MIKPQIWQQYLQNGPKLILAVSGGMDSIALLHYLYHQLPKPTDQLVIAHFDHQTRIDSAKDADFDSRTAQNLGLTIETTRRNIPKIAQQKKQNLEATARQERYTFFEEIRLRHQAKYIITAHHQDDQIETIILNWNRGAGLKGLQGIQTYDSKRHLLRPLLTTSQTTIKEYTQQQQLEYKIDQTNFNTTYQRNLLRQKIIPRLQSQYPDYKQTILDIPPLCHTAHTNAILALHKFNIHLNSQQQFNRQTFKELPQHLQNYWLYLCLSKEQLIPTKKLIEQIKDLAHQNKSGQKLLVQTKTIWIDPYQISITDKETKEPQTINLQPKPSTIKWYDQDLLISTNKTPNGIPIPNNQKITIRNFQPGDRILLPGHRQHTKLKKIFINKKIPYRLRYNLPIITIEGNILGIPGVISSKMAQETAQNHCNLNITLVNSKH